VVEREPSSPHRSTGLEKSCVETSAECSEETRSMFGRFKLNAPWRYRDDLLEYESPSWVDSGQRQTMVTPTREAKTWREAVCEITFVD